MIWDKKRRGENLNSERKIADFSCRPIDKSRTKSMRQAMHDWKTFSLTLSIFPQKAHRWESWGKVFPLLNFSSKKKIWKILYFIKRFSGKFWTKKKFSYFKFYEKNSNKNLQQIFDETWNKILEKFSLIILNIIKGS